MLNKIRRREDGRGFSKETKTVNGFRTVNRQHKVD